MLPQQRNVDLIKKKKKLQGKVNHLINKLDLLLKIATFEPQYVYFAYTSGFKHKKTFSIRAIPYKFKYLKQLDD